MDKKLKKKTKNSVDNLVLLWYSSSSGIWYLNHRAGSLCREILMLCSDPVKLAVEALSGFCWELLSIFIWCWISSHKSRGRCWNNGMAVTGRKLFLNFYQMVRSHNEGYLLWVWVNTECGREGDPGSMKNINQQII